MVTVHSATTDKITAWRVRDALACHPLLGGATADIAIEATHAHVIVRGWIANKELSLVVRRLARQSAGRRTIQVTICSRQDAIVHRTGGRSPDQFAAQTPHGR